MSVQIIRYKDRAEWLEGRKGGIGSSEVGTILGANPWETPYQLWRRKKGIDPPKEENFYMKAGHYLEDAVARFYADSTGVEIIKRSAEDFLIVNSLREYLRVSPDRTFWLPNMTRNEANKGILECKTTQLPVDADSIPQHWYCQLQWQLGTAEKDTGALAWLTQGRDFGFVNYDFDSDFFKFMLEEVDKFWTDYIIGDAVPENMSVEDVMIRAPRSAKGKSIEATEEISTVASQLVEAKAAEKAAKDASSELADKLKLFMGDAEVLTYKGLTLATWKSSKDKTFFDLDGFAAKHPKMAEEFTKTGPGDRRFLLKK